MGEMKIKIIGNKFKETNSKITTVEEKYGELEKYAEFVPNIVNYFPKDMKKNMSLGQNNFKMSYLIN